MQRHAARLIGGVCLRLAFLTAVITAAHVDLRFALVFRGGRTFADSCADRVPGTVPASAGSGEVAVAIQRDSAGEVVYDVVVGDLAGNAVRIDLRRGVLHQDTRAELRNVTVASVLALLLGLGLSWAVARLITDEVDRTERALREIVPR